MNRSRILEGYVIDPDAVLCEGKVRLFGFLWEVKCQLPLSNPAGVCWRCGTLGPKHPDTIFWKNIRKLAYRENFGVDTEK